MYNYIIWEHVVNTIIEHSAAPPDMIALKEEVEEVAKNLHLELIKYFRMLKRQGEKFQDNIDDHEARITDIESEANIERPYAGFTIESYVDRCLNDFEIDPDQLETAIKDFMDKASFSISID